MKNYSPISVKVDFIDFKNVVSLLLVLFPPIKTNKLHLTLKMIVCLNNIISQLQFWPIL